MDKINAFISYSHEEKIYIPELLTYINADTCPKIKFWYDELISPGAEWDTRIKEHLDQAEIVMLLLSQNFLRSNYISQIELKRAIEKHNQGTCRVIPIFVRKCILDNYPEIRKLNGLPRGMKYLSDMGEEKWGHYAEIVNSLNEVAIEMETQKNIQAYTSLPNTSEALLAQSLLELKTKNKIFLSIPNSLEGMRKRKQFMYQVEGKVKYEKWPFEIIPSLEQVELLQKSAQIENDLSHLIQSAIYSIHIGTSHTDLIHSMDRMQYEIAKRYSSVSCCTKNILWFLDPSSRQHLPKEFSMNPLIVGDDFEGIFELIRSLEEEKRKKVKELTKTFSTEKKVFMFYDFIPDHNSDLRIKAKNKIEEHRDIVVKFSMPNASFEKDKEDVSSCNGACIFYGSTDTQWFAMRQSILLDSVKINSRAIVVDEPQIEEKIERDVSKNAFITIKGSQELENGIENFINML